MKNKKLASLSIIKAIATFLIVIFHYCHFAPTEPPFFSALYYVYKYGYYLVALFFMISSFLFFYSYSDSIIKKEISLYDFMKSKFKRFFTLLFITTIVTGILQWMHLYFKGNYFVHPADLENLVYSLLGIQHIGLKELGFNGPAWYISILLVCYFLFFCLLHIFGNEKTTESITLICIFSLIFSLILRKLNLTYPLVRYECYVGYISFSIGGLIYVLTKKNKSIINLISISFLVLLITLWFVFKKNRIDIFGNDYWIICVLIVFPSILLLILNFNFNFNFNSYFSFSTIDKISYSVYLWHFPIEIIFSLLITNHEYYNYKYVFLLRIVFTYFFSTVYVLFVLCIKKNIEISKDKLRMVLS